MQADEKSTFLTWATSIGINEELGEKLLPHLRDDSDLNPEMPYWIESVPRVIWANDPKHGFGLPKEPIEEGYLIIGCCRNGDPVVVNIRDPRLPVFYISHEQMHSNPLATVIRKVDDSIAEYDDAISDPNSDIPLDYWESPKKR